MRKLARTTLIAATMLGLSAGTGQAQSVSLSVGVGSLFAGVGFGMHVGSYDPGPAFAGFSVGLALRSHQGYYDDYGYGIYSEGYGSDPCWDPYYDDYYWDSYYDPYYGCWRSGPNVRYRSAYYGSQWGYSSSWYSWGHRNAFVYIRDPYRSPWGPGWAYDPWGSYWNGYWDGYGSSYGGYYDGYWGGSRGTRVVYGGNGRTGVSIHRPSPLSIGGTGYKESPRGSGARTATRRTATPRAGSANAAASVDGRTAARPTGRSGVGSPAAAPRTGRGSPVTPPTR